MASAAAADTGRRLIIAVYIIALAIGTWTHVRDIIDGGVFPYRYAPLWLNTYWTALTLFDPLAIMLLCTRLRFGVILTLAIMLTDVAINSYATAAIWKIPFAENIYLLLQAAFLAFVLLTAPRLLRSQ